MSGQKKTRVGKEKTDKKIKEREREIYLKMKKGVDPTRVPSIIIPVLTTSNPLRLKGLNIIIQTSIQYWTHVLKSVP